MAIRRSGIRLIPHWHGGRAGLYRTSPGLDGSRWVSAGSSWTLTRQCRHRSRAGRGWGSVRTNTRHEAYRSGTKREGRRSRRISCHPVAIVGDEGTSMEADPGERERLHRLVDALPAGELGAVERCLELFSECGVSFVQALLRAPEATDHIEGIRLSLRPPRVTAETALSSEPDRESSRHAAHPPLLRECAPSDGRFPRYDLDAVHRATSDSCSRTPRGCWC